MSISFDKLKRHLGCTYVTWKDNINFFQPTTTYPKQQSSDWRTSRKAFVWLAALVIKRNREFDMSLYCCAVTESSCPTLPASENRKSLYNLAVCESFVLRSVLRASKSGLQVSCWFSFKTRIIQNCSMPLKNKLKQIFFNFWRAENLLVEVVLKTTCLIKLRVESCRKVLENLFLTNLNQ